MSLLTAPNIAGARWWKFDVHTHTPASTDWKSEEEPGGEVTPQQWLQTVMRAGLDCVAVTDHNSGAWVDTLKAAYVEMADHPGEYFRPLMIFPGVELTVNGGIHLLVLFETRCTTRDVDALLGRVGYSGTSGNSDGCTTSSLVHVLEACEALGTLPVFAHADQAKGLLQTKPNSRGSVVDATMLRQLFDVADRVAAIEVVDPAKPKPQCYEDSKVGWTEVVGSDFHSLRSPLLGQRYTWIKMGAPSLEGLRLALLDGNVFSVQRSDSTRPPPDGPPGNWIESIEVRDARLMGREQPLQIPLNPRMNALIGGRGTGKSSVVHLLRAALGRHHELMFDDRSASSKDREGRERPSNQAEETFVRFLRIANDRRESGAITSGTTVSLRYWHDDRLFKIEWSPGAQDPLGVGSRVYEFTPAALPEGADGSWTLATSQAVYERFPIRIFSQGQLIELAGEDGRGSDQLFVIINEGAGVLGLLADFVARQNEWRTVRARLRELTSKVAHRDRVVAALEDVKNKIAALEQTPHAEVLREHQKRTRQQRDLRAQQTHVEELLDGLMRVRENCAPVEVTPGLFDETDALDRALMDASTQLATAMAQSATALERLAQELREALGVFVAGTSDGPLGQAAAAASAEYQLLVDALKAQGVRDPRELGTLVQDRHRLESELLELDSLADRHRELVAEEARGLEALLESRRAISRRRSEFLRTTLANNRFIRMDVIPYGRDAESVERRFRTMLRIERGFESDIYTDGEAAASRGILAKLYENLPSPDRGLERQRELETRLERLKQVLTNACLGTQRAAISFDDGWSLGGKLTNRLRSEYEKSPEYLDGIIAWFPPDSLRVEYSRHGDGGDFDSIALGSPGEKSSAMLAFFLSYGSEPIVLDQPEDDLDNHLIYDLLVQQLRESKSRRQIIVVTHNANIVVNGDVEMVHVFDYRAGQCRVVLSGCLQEAKVRAEVCSVLEGGREAFERRHRRLRERGTHV